MERPALKRLLRDVEAGASTSSSCTRSIGSARSLVDFASIVELFERHDVSFVSVTQQFNTTTRWGG